MAIGGNAYGSHGTFAACSRGQPGPSGPGFRQGLEAHDSGSGRPVDLDSLSTEAEYDLHWQMPACERFALKDILRRIQPEATIEVGTYKGGSLQVLSRYSQQVISIDIDAKVGERLGSRFPNVDFRSGPSERLLPLVLEEIEARKLNLEFVLIDGDHSTDGVRRDLNALLALRPSKPCVILIHDSFNPECRAGIRGAAWASSPHVHMVELDFVPGIYHENAYDTAGARTMWGGFACAILLPQARHQALEVSASQQGLFEAVFTVSSHKRRTGFRRRARQVIKRMSEAWR